LATIRTPRNESAAQLRGVGGSPDVCAHDLDDDGSNVVVGDALDVSIPHLQAVVYSEEERKTQEKKKGPQQPSGIPRTFFSQRDSGLLPML
jgi:hypothetical protein